MGGVQLGWVGSSWGGWGPAGVGGVQLGWVGSSWGGWGPAGVGGVQLGWVGSSPAGVGGVQLVCMHEAGRWHVASEEWHQTTEVVPLIPLPRYQQGRGLIWRVQ